MSIRTIFDGSKDNYISDCFYKNFGKIDHSYSQDICATYLLRVAEGDILTYNGTISSTTYLCNFYNRSLEFVSNTDTTSYTITVPENAFYVSFNITKANINSVTITCNSSNDSYLNDSYYTGKLLYSSDTDDGKTPDSYIKGGTGAIISNSGTSVTSEIDLTNVLYIQILNEYNNVNAGVFFDESGSRISNLLGVVSDPAIIPIPSNAKTLKCTFTSDNLFQIYSYTTSDSSTPVDPTLPGETLPKGIYINSEKVSYNGKSLSSIIDYILSRVN